MNIIYIGTRLEAYKALELFSLNNFKKSVDVLTFENTILSDYLNVKTTKNFRYTISPSNKKESLLLLDELLSQKDYILLLSAGFPYLLSKQILENHNIHFINLHPHVLPKWKGINAIKDSFSERESYYGATLHYINEFVDDGEIINQEAYNLKDLKLDSIYDFVFSIIEPNVLLNGLKKEIKKIIK